MVTHQCKKWRGTNKQLPGLWQDSRILGSIIKINSSPLLLLVALLRLNTVNNIRPAEG